MHRREYRQRRPSRPRFWWRDGQGERLFTVNAKWWYVELRFAKPLTRRQIKIVLRHLPNWNGGGVGKDGAIWDQWWNSWPGAGDEALIFETVERIGFDAKVRAIPFGRDCPGASCFVAFDDSHRCRLGSADSIHPTPVESDWVYVKPRSSNG
jgi:hypothetical protein